MTGDQSRDKAFGLNLRLAWRNIWRQKRRTWLTALAMIFSNILLVFMISLQFGSYEMMINNTLRMFSGQVQVQHTGYQDEQKMRQVIAGVQELAQAMRERFPDASVAARANAFVLLSSDERSFATQVVGVEPKHEPGLSTVPGLVSEGRYLSGMDAPEIVIGGVLARVKRVCQRQGECIAHHEEVAGAQSLDLINRQIGFKFLRWQHRQRSTFQQMDHGQELPRPVHQRAKQEKWRGGCRMIGADLCRFGGLFFQ